MIKATYNVTTKTNKSFWCKLDSGEDSLGCSYDFFTIIGKEQDDGIDFDDVGFVDGMPMDCWLFNYGKPYKIIKWIQATPQNIEEHFFEKGVFSIEKAREFVFLQDDKTICETVPQFENGRLFFYAWNVSEDHSMGDSMSCVTHFALRSDFDKILPKENL